MTPRSLPIRQRSVPRRLRFTRRSRLAVAVAATLVLSGCSAELDPVAPADGDRQVPALAADFERGMNLEPIGGLGGLLRERDIAGALDALVGLGATHVAVVPSFFQRQLDDVEMYWQPSRSAVDGQVARVVEAAHARGLRVLLKPHLWLEDRSDGSWRGDIDPAPDAWPEWSSEYRGVVVEYARLAADLEVESFSLGSELTALAIGRAPFWRGLAAEVRTHFTGRITYAANWDREFEAISWWDAVDQIGVDAFWPLQESEAEQLTPALCRTRLAAIRERLGGFAARTGRPILLTEIGYKSARNAAYRPWEWHDGQAPDPGAQELLYRCIRDVLGETAWLDGTYFWIWSTSPTWGGPHNSDFTPRGKPAEGVLAGWYQAR
jgi:hypothetical protein